MATSLASGAAALLAGGLLLVPAAASGRPLALTASSASGIWHDPVTVTLRGVGCNPTLDPFAPAGAQALAIEAQLREACAGGQTPSPFEIQGRVDLPAPGAFTIRVRDVDGTFTAVQVTTQEPSTARLVVPEVVQAGDEVIGSVTFRGRCVSATHERRGSVIEIRVDPDCTYPGPSVPLRVQTLEIRLGTLPEGRYEVRLLDSTWLPLSTSLARRFLLVTRPGACVPDDTTLCLHDSRFRVTGSWRDFAQRSGALHARPLPGTDETGLGWFFDPGNVELTLKVLDGCAVNGRFWVFVAAGSTVEYSLTVTDTHTGRSRTYGKPLGERPRLIADVGALEVCS